MSEPVILRAGEHDAALTEWRGKFRIVCGCRWTSDYATNSEVHADFRAHLQAVKRGEE